MGHEWGPVGHAGGSLVGSGGRHATGWRQRQFFKTEFILNLYIKFPVSQRTSFLDFSVWLWKRCEQPSCPVQPGPVDPRTTRTRSSGRGTREADIVPRNVGGTTAPCPSRFLCRSASRHVQGTYYCGTGKQSKGIFLIKVHGPLTGRLKMVFNLLLLLLVDCQEM